MTRSVLDRPNGALTVNTFGDRGSHLRPVLLIHPINLRGMCWADVIPALSRNRLVIVPDMTGFGDSPTAETYHVTLWAQDCLDAADAVGAEQFHAVGGSLGGAIATFLAGTVPSRVASVMAIGSQLASPDPDAASVLSTLETMSVPEMFSDIIPKHSLGPHASRLVIDKVLMTTNPNGPEDVRRVWKAAASTDVREQARNVTCPSTVVTGEFDSTCRPAQGAEMAQVLGTTHHIISGVGHLPMLEDPLTLTRLILAHLDRAEGGVVP